MSEESDGDDGSVPNLAALQNRMDALRVKIGQLEDELAERDQRIDELEVALEEEREARADLEERVADVEQRTDMLALVDRVDDLDGRQRSAALLQHLKREAEAGDGPDRASLDRDAAERALQFPDVDRTTIYDDMARAERLVGDDAVCAYTDGTLRLDLEAGELPAEARPHRSGVSR